MTKNVPAKIAEMASYDPKGRLRNKTIAFRVSPEEAKQIEFAISLTGLQKQEYLIARSLNRDISVRGNCKVHKAVFDRLEEVIGQLKRIESGRYVDAELMDNIKLIVSVVDGLYKKEA